MKKIPYIHIVLFIATFGSTLFFGALQRGVNPIEEPLRIIEGFPFAFTLMLILLSHELSHYYASRWHKTEATLPYFIPAPSLIGTFGAFIKMKSPIVSRQALIDIGASGPIVGFIFSVIASLIGLYFSEVLPPPEKTEGFLNLGDSLLFTFLTKLVLGVDPGGDNLVLLHPVAFAGWIGLFVTTLNLLPIGQLDGGHIAYAFLGERHKKVSAFLVGTLAVIGFFFWEGWIIWAVLMLVLGLKHPPVIYWEMPLPASRRRIGITSLIIFLITFIPKPFSASF